MQQQLAAGRHQGAGAGARGRPARRDASRAAQDPATAPVRMYYVGWSSSTGEADWAMRPLLASESWPPQALQHRVLQERRSRRRHQEGAGRPPTRAEKAKIYKDAQKRIWNDAPWALRWSTEQLLSVRAASKLAGVYVIPDGSRSTSTKSDARSDSASAGRSTAAPRMTRSYCIVEAPARASLPTLLIVARAGVPVRPPAARRSGAAGRRAGCRRPRRWRWCARTSASTSRCRSSSCASSRDVLQGDFGQSLRTKRPVSTEIAERFMPTLLAHDREHGVGGGLRHGDRHHCRRCGATVARPRSA